MIQTTRILGTLTGENNKRKKDGKVSAETQTSTINWNVNKSRIKLEELEEKKNKTKNSYKFLNPNTFSTSWNPADDDPPQWLIEEALKTESESTKDNRFDTSADLEENISLKLRYEMLISELEEELEKTKAVVKEALKEKYDEKEKYERDLERIKKEANKKNDILQEKVIEICVSVLEKFGPDALNDKTKVMEKCPKRMRFYGKFSKTLHKKLRKTVLKLNRVKQEFMKTRKALEEKNHEYETLKKCFSRLKKELVTTDMNLNNLISENMTMRKKFEDTKEWMENKMTKDQYERHNNARFNDMHKSRELTNLKKKADEDCITIAELRNKLHRTESANANKGFLLNSYKSQLTELTKECDQCTKKNKELESENNSLRTKNAKLKAKISLLSSEKEKLASGSEKSETDVNEKQKKMKLTSQCEISNQQEMQKMEMKYDEILDGMKMKVDVLENCKTEYSAAIKEFLRKIYQYYGEKDAELNLNYTEESEREAHETACSILNITHGQLSQFMKGKPDSINSWLADLCKITSKKQFSGSLAKFLLRKVIQKDEVTKIC